MIVKSGELMLKRPKDVDSTLKRGKGFSLWSFPKTRAILEKLNDDLTKTLDTISKSERMINTNMSEIGDQYKSQSD